MYSCWLGLSQLSPVMRILGLSQSHSCSMLCEMALFPGVFGFTSRFRTVSASTHDILMAQNLKSILQVGRQWHCQYQNCHCVSFEVSSGMSLPAGGIRAKPKELLCCWGPASLLVSHNGQLLSHTLRSRTAALQQLLQLVTTVHWQALSHGVTSVCCPAKLTCVISECCSK